MIYRLLVYRSIVAEGEDRAKRELALNLSREGLPSEVVACGIGPSVEEDQQLQRQMHEAAQS